MSKWIYKVQLTGGSVFLSFPYPLPLPLLNLGGTNDINYLHTTILFI